MSLTKLIEAVEAGMDPGLYYHIPQSLEEHAETICAAHYGSLDAAKRLHDALLPGWRVEFFNLDGEVILGRNRPINRTYGDAMNSGEVARAWLLAILRALEEEGR